MNDIVQCGPFAYPGDQKKLCACLQIQLQILILEATLFPNRLSKIPRRSPTFQCPVPVNSLLEYKSLTPRHIDEGAASSRRWDIRRGMVQQ